MLGTQLVNQGIGNFWRSALASILSHILAEDFIQLVALNNVSKRRAGLLHLPRESTQDLLLFNGVKGLNCCARC